MRTTLGHSEVVNAYLDVGAIYPTVPPLCLWRAWELAAYRRLTLEEPVLDLGCGDGRFFRLAWPAARGVTGVDADINIADAAVRSGVYEDVRVAPGSQLPFRDCSFATVFANCSLEHMDDLDKVLAEVRRCLRPGGLLIASVVTDRWDTWATLPALARHIAGEAAEARLRQQFRAGHHVVSAFTAEGWLDALSSSGLQPVLVVPILPQVTARVFLLLDALWHLPTVDPRGEVGGGLERYLGALPNTPQGGATILAGLLQLEHDEQAGAGLVFAARRGQSEISLDGVNESR
jgi:SAM-dependent methyltransferase